MRMPPPAAPTQRTESVSTTGAVAAPHNHTRAARPANRATRDISDSAINQARDYIPSADEIAKRQASTGGTLVTPRKVSATNAPGRNTSAGAAGKVKAPPLDDSMSASKRSNPSVPPRSPAGRASAALGGSYRHDSASNASSLSPLAKPSRPVSAVTPGVVHERATSSRAVQQDSTVKPPRASARALVPGVVAEAAAAPALTLAPGVDEKGEELLVQEMKISVIEQGASGPGATRASGGYQSDHFKETTEEFDTATAVVAELAIDTEALEEERDALKRELEAERASKQNNNGPVIVAAIREESFKVRNEGPSKKKMALLAILALLVIAGVAVGVYFGLKGKDDGEEGEVVEVVVTVPPETQEPTLPFFDRLGAPIDSTEIYKAFGSDVSMNEDGTVLAVADKEGVFVYEFDGTSWQEQEGSPIMPPDCITNVLELEEETAQAIRVKIMVDLSRTGKYIAVGCPEAPDVNSTDSFVGKVELYHNADGMWDILGEPIYGPGPNSFFGATVSLSGDGGIVAVGRPGLEGGVNVYAINQGNWIDYGGEILTTISVGEVSLSSVGDIVAVGGVASGEGQSVVQVFRREAGSWTSMGSGIQGNIEETSYLCELSADGSVVAVSNFYVSDFGPTEGALNDALDVRAFQWSESEGEWLLMGSNLHASSPGEKSGYFITLSDDGTLMGMGDPGRRSETGAVTGHAHIYHWTGTEWIQLGRNEEGEDGGDNFGFSVALSSDGTRFAVSAPFSRANGFEHGRVVVYDIDIEPFLN